MNIKDKKSTLKKKVSDKVKLKVPVEKKYKTEKFIVNAGNVGIFFGEISSQNEMIIEMKDSRCIHGVRLKKGIGNSGLAVYGVNSKESMISVSVPYRKIQALEVLKASEACIKSISACPDAEY